MHTTSRKFLVLLGAAGLMIGGISASSSATAAPKDTSSTEKVSICHRTGSATNPYVKITVSKTGAEAHLANHDGTLNWPAAPYKAKVLTVGGDFVANPVTGCTVPPVTPYPGPGVNCVVSVGVTQTATTVTGTSADDTIDCTLASPGKTIVGLDGNDTITGTAFGDVIDGGNGNDTITGGGGDDVIEGGNGNDTLTGSAGNDVVTDNGDGNDTITP